MEHPALRERTGGGPGGGARACHARLAALCAALAVVVLLASGCAGASSAPVGPRTPPAAAGTASGTAADTAANAVILAVLTNIQANGFDADPTINNGLGGLWINWRYGTQPLQTNLNGSGEPDDASDGAPVRHDRLTDLRYLHNLWQYAHLHPGDTRFADEISRYTAIVKAEFSPAHDDRGWLYDEFIDLYQLSGDSAYRDAARQLADYFATVLVKPGIGAVYKTSADQPSGYYRVDLALEVGCALIQAGTVFGRPDWASAGQRVVQFVYDHAYVAAYHTFLSQMSHVLLPDGTANPNETIEVGTFEHTTIQGGQVRAGASAQIILSLLHTAQVTHDARYLARATDLLDPLTAQSNTLGLWDARNLGYYSQVIFPGATIHSPGVPKANQGKKESGRQLQMLEAFRVANTLTNDRYQQMQALMEQVTLGKAYYPAGHGYVFEESATWQILTLHGGQPEDWVTTEAMGIALEALFAVEMPAPW